MTATPESLYTIRQESWPNETCFPRSGSTRTAANELASTTRRLHDISLGEGPEDARRLREVSRCTGRGQPFWRLPRRRALTTVAAAAAAAAAAATVVAADPLPNSSDVGPWPAGTAGIGDTVEIRPYADSGRRVVSATEDPVEKAAIGSGARTRELIPLFLSASHPRRQGFARVINLSDRAGTVAVTAIDDAGVEFGPLSFDLPPGGVQHFNSNDLEYGNESKLIGATGRPTKGNWRLLLETDLEIEALAYVRTADGFLTSMNETGRTWNADRSHFVPTFNPASNQRQRSILRLVNPSSVPADVTIHGWDDEGDWHNLSGTVPAGVALTLDAVDLERGLDRWSGRLGDGAGKWRLRVEATAPVYVMALLSDPRGYVTNLSVSWRFSYGSTAPNTTGGRIRLFKSASHPTQQGFLRIINYSDRGGVITIRALDDAGFVAGPVSIEVPARGARHVNSDDLEFGNADKLKGRLGPPSSGDWRLLLETDLSIVALSYVRTRDGFLTSLNEHITLDDGWHYVPTFNPGSNRRQQSVLRLDNVNDQPVEVSIRGIDDAGRPSRSVVRGTLPGNGTVRLTSQELEEGPMGWSGSLGDGSGKWRLLIPNRGFYVMSLLEDPRGYLTNLSTAQIPIGAIGAIANRLPPAAEPSAGLLRSSVDSYTERTAEFTLDLFAVTADSNLHPLNPSDLEIRSWTDPSTGSTFNFAQKSVRQHNQAYLGPYSATFLFDQSGSITSTDPHDARVAAAQVFLDNLSSGDEVGLLAFADGGNLPYDPVTAYADRSGNRFTMDPNGFDAALADLADQEGGGTPLYDSIIAAVNYTAQYANNSNRAVLVFTDGQDTASNSTEDDAIGAATRRGIPLHTIALSQGVDLGVLSRLAGETEGSLTRATNAGALISYYGALGPFLSGSSRFYRTKWRVSLSGGRMRFGPGAWFTYGVLVALPGGVQFVPFRVDF